MTDGAGRFVAKLKGPEGRIARVEIECPKGWLARSGNYRELPIRFVRPIASSGLLQVPMEARFECARKNRKVVLLVRTNGRSGLPIRALGRRVATTDREGVAQTIFEGEPGEEFEVSIDTTNSPTLRPSMPNRRLTIPSDSQILVFDQKFEEKVKKKRTKRKRNKRGMRPRRI
jgi:hypothetical protein